MLSTIEAVNSVVNNFIWGVPAMICIIGVGLYLSIRTRFLQIRKFPYSMKVTLGRMMKKKEASDGALTPFQAVCTALAATVGSRCGRCYRYRRPRSGILDVGICAARHVHQVCRSNTCCTLPRDQCTGRPGRRSHVLY